MHEHLTTMTQVNKTLSWCWQTRDAFRGQSRSPNMVPFDMLGKVSY